MRKIVASPVVYVALYIVLMFPTYILPFTGSNSPLMNAVVASHGQGMFPTFWPHLLVLLLLIVLVWIRGSLVGKTWLSVFPTLALVFDLAPVLSLIPLVPTVMHLLAMILGVRQVTATVQSPA